MEENEKTNIKNEGNISISKGLFNRTKQSIGKKESSPSFLKLVGAFLAALAAIGGVIVFLMKTGILSSNL